MNVNIYGITIGDWSGDGHNQSEDYYFKTNKNAKEISDAFKQGQLKSGVDFDKVLCDYEDNTLSNNQVLALKNLGVQFCEEDYCDMDGMTDEVELNPESLFNTIMGMIKTQLPDMEYDLVRPPIIINGIGYGVFNN